MLGRLMPREGRFFELFNQHADRIVVTLHATGRSLTVADNGRGIDAGAGRPDSFGLRGLRERAATLGARIEITTNNGQGTVVRCRVPRR